MQQAYKIFNVILILLSVILLLLLGYILGKKFDIAVDENEDFIAITYSVNEQKMRRLMSLIEHQYVDDINTNELVDKTISFVMSNLDPHSVYIPKETTNKEKSYLEGEFKGIGIEFFISNDTAVITKVFPTSPNKSLLSFGDRILAINNNSVLKADLDSIATIIKNSKSNIVNLKIKRGEKIQNIQTKKGLISSPSILDYYMLDDEVGYIKLSRFIKSSYQEFHKAILDLNEQGMKSLIFDLRGNPGGLMSVAEEITDEFLKEDQLIVFTIDKQGKKSFRYATKKGSFEEMPLFILVDEASASASEIVAGAIQDQDAGTIVGRRTYGKGLVQKEISLGDGSKVRLTTAHYYTPTGRSIQKPYNLTSDEYNKDITKRFIKGEFFSLDSIKKIDSLKFTTPKGKTVYGGGGIIPDVFVPLDTVQLRRIYYVQEYGGYVSMFTFRKLDEDIDKFRKIKKEHFISFYNPEDITNSFLEEIKLSGFSFAPENKKYLSTYIKAQMARYLYDDEAYYRIMRGQDKTIKKAYNLASGLE